MPSPKDTSVESLMDRVHPGWRKQAAEAGAYWRKTFQTPSEQTLLAREQEALAKYMGRGNRPW